MLRITGWCYFDLYRNKKLRTPALGDWENPGELERSGRIFDSSTGPVDPELIREAQIGYYACITHVDHQIGRLLQSLTESGVMDNTVIIFTSDHGEELGEILCLPFWIWLMHRYRRK